ncbi:hypothetical protein BpHYR1_040426 [Brachionus plicatilis]|uniref:Uncharacterized protein n=1 Tax=Brachionus plicatilis TaxID=10195 RepID=A0A3M7RLP6_BRAPC|nr:hypothetical protein BpHYR1_040426 [Brachionus plicatilis]
MLFNGLKIGLDSISLSFRFADRTGEVSIWLNLLMNSFVVKRPIFKFATFKNSIFNNINLKFTDFILKSKKEYYENIIEVPQRYECEFE